MLLLIRSDKARGLDNAFNRMKTEFGAKARFIKLEFSSLDGEDAAGQFSIQNPPAFVLADGKGNVVAKQEGLASWDAIAARLRSLTGNRDR